ncbi:L,D-transpeptidase [Streptomyces sp. JJ36]|uniref:L,D-transpeptidase n=1 Tax=Streptomyces sp. JJ36 TaxID=2736645 RepID=UPI001F01E4A4|nr:L,D-transpeptidase [Streptomyces sp. JJ36]MCF6524138.1 L,D-transpeptidase family protein [Streptomyces sp. JJ36]
MTARTPRPRLGAALLAAATALPLFLGGAATSAAAATTDDGPGPGGHVPESRLVPGFPLPPKQRYQRITPDQGAFPPREDPGPAARRPADPDAPAQGADRRYGRPGPERRTPGPEYATPTALIEYVPPGEEVTVPGSGTRPARPPNPRQEPRPQCSESTGPYQSFVERRLGLEVDGVQSPADCRAIQKYQTRIGIYPNSGFAGPTTWKVMTLRWARANPDQLRGCPRTSGTVACLDLSRQIMWVRHGDRMIYEPVPIRSGKPGYETRTGWHRITNRVRHEHSRLYDAPMPFSQYFNGGQAIHGVYDDIYTGPGSHGCVNLQYEDAKRLWHVLSRGDRVYIWGRKPNR